MQSSDIYIANDRPLPRVTPLHAAAAALTPPRLAVALVVGAVAAVGAVGADARWLAALGTTIAGSRHVPDGVPFAAAATDGWPNVLVLAELAFAAAVGVLGDTGIFALQLAAVAACLTLVAADMRALGARQGGAALVLLATALAAASALAVARLQLFSLALFPVAVWLLRRDAERPTRRLWLLVPLVALWGNLHGAVLVGVGVALAYLAFSARRRARERVALGASLLAALCATPALTGTPSYYAGVLGNEAARRGEGLWAPLSTSPLDLAFVAAAGLLALLAIRARPPVWELVAAAALLLLTVQTARSGVWLALFLAPRAAAALRVDARVRPSVGAAVGCCAILLLVLGLARGPLQTGAGSAVLAQAAGAGVVLAEPVLAEQTVAAGGRIWIGNPLDAFAARDQRAYLAWVQGERGGDAALAHADAVLVARDGPAAARLEADGRFRVLASDGRTVLYTRAAAGA
jgi:hypothetical protein